MLHHNLSVVKDRIQSELSCRSELKRRDETLGLLTEKGLKNVKDVVAMKGQLANLERRFRRSKDKESVEEEEEEEGEEDRTPRDEGFFREKMEEEEK